MFRITRWIHNFFGFSRAQVNAFIILLPLMALLIFSEPVYRWMHSSNPIDRKKERAELDSMIAQWTFAEKDSVTKSLHTDKRILFAFNPNTASNNELTRLGFSTTLSTRLIRYRDKGGAFKIKRDLLKLYGMDSTLYVMLEKYIQLPDETAAKPRTALSHSPVKLDKGGMVSFDLNTADTLQLKKIHGIGTKLSLRIVAYREKLGGFVSKAQLSEVWGLDSTVVNKLIKASFIGNNFVPRMIALNTARAEELSTHPYLSKSAAKAIVSYRFQHGDLKSIEDLRKIPAIDSKTIEKIVPYLIFN